MKEMNRFLALPCGPPKPCQSKVGSGKPISDRSLSLTELRIFNRKFPLANKRFYFNYSKICQLRIQSVIAVGPEASSEQTADHVTDLCKPSESE